MGVGARSVVNTGHAPTLLMFGASARIRKRKRNLHSLASTDQSHDTSLHLQPSCLP